MNRKLIWFFKFYFFIGQIFVFSQFTILGNNKGWLPIDSNNGGIITNVIDIQLHMAGNQVYNFPNWSIVGRVTSPITNSENKVFPVEKMKFRYRGHRLVQYFANLNPTANQIGVIQSNIAMGFTPKYFIQNSPLNPTVPTGKYGSIVLEYDIIIDAGNYLSALKSWQNYRINYEFSLLDGNGRSIGVTTFPIDMQIRYDGNYQELPNLSIQVSAASQNAELELRSVTDYNNGVTKVYDNALVIEANTSYEISVKSLDDKLRSVVDELDVSLVNVQLKDSQTGSLFNKVKINTNPKTVATGVAISNQKKYSVIYSIDSDDKLFQVTSGSYSVPIIFTISPL